MMRLKEVALSNASTEAKIAGLAVLLDKELLRLSEIVLNTKKLQGPQGEQGLQGPKGEQGDRGFDGVNGKDGSDGKDGKDGHEGKDGVGVQDAKIDFDGSLVITLTNGREINAGDVVPEGVADKIKVIKSGGGNSQTVLDAIEDLQAQINVLTGIDGELGTMAQQNDTAVDINGGSIDSTAIGAAVPATGVFTTLTASALTATGQTSLGGVVDVESVRVSQTAGSAGSNNYIELIGSTGSGTPAIQPWGTASNVGLNFRTRGTGAYQFATSSSASAVQFRISPTTSAVNYVQVTGAATTKATVISSAGSDSNISSVFQSKGTGAIDLAAGSSGVNISNGGTVTAITRTAGGSGYTTAITATVSAPTTAGGVQATANAYAGAITTVVTSGGTGYTLNDVITVSGGTGTQSQSYKVSGVSGGVITAVTVQNYGQYTTLPTSPVSVTGGTGSSATLTLSNWSMTSIAIATAGSGYVEQPTVSFSGGGGSGAAAYATVGSEPTIKSLFGSTGAGLALSTAYGPQLRLLDIGDGTRPLLVNGGSSGGAQIAGLTTSTGVLGLSAGGGNNIAFYTNGRVTTQQFQVAHTASAVNYVQVTGAATGAGPTITAGGSDASVPLVIAPKGGTTTQFWTSGGRQFQVGHTASTVNYATVTGGATGSGPIFSVNGSDTNIDLTLTPKGTGNVRFGTYTASMALTVQGYIEIKDSGGTVRKLAVIA